MDTAEGGAESRVSREIAFEGPVFDVFSDTVRLPGGNTARRDVVHHPGSVVIVPVVSDDIVLVSQYRYAIGAQVLELPAGTLDPGESPDAAASRELQEETGFTAGRLIEIGRWCPTPGYSDEVMVFFVASDLTPGHASPEEDEAIQVVRLGRDAALRSVRSGEIHDLKTAVGILWLSTFGAGSEA